MNTIWECSVNFIEVILFYLFISQKLHKRKDIIYIKTKQYAFLFLRFFIVCLMNQIGLNSMFTLSFSCILEVIFACLFYSDNLLYKAFTGMLYTVLCMLAEFIPFFCLTIFSDFSSYDLLMSGTIRILTTSLYLSLVAVFVFLFRYFFNNEASASVFQRIVYSIISLLGVLVGHYILLTMVISERYELKEISLRLSVIYILYMFLFIALLVFIYRLGITYSTSQKLLELQTARVLEEQEYQSIIEKITALREMKHDMENHLDTLKLMAEKTSSPEMQQYIDNLRTNLEDSRFFLSTGNLAVDCILSSKIATAKNTHIQTDYSVLLPDGFEMDAVSVCSLLGNLWDNAIDACKSMFQSDISATPFINFYIKPYLDMTIIHIENNFVGELIRTPDGQIQTSKDKFEHGIGLKRIENLVNKAQGIMKIDIHNQIFTVHILIPQTGEPS